MQFYVKLVLVVMGVMVFVVGGAYLISSEPLAPDQSGRGSFFSVGEGEYSKERSASLGKERVMRRGGRKIQKATQQVMKGLSTHLAQLVLEVPSEGRPVVDHALTEDEIKLLWELGELEGENAFYLFRETLENEGFEKQVWLSDTAPWYFHIFNGIALTDPKEAVRVFNGIDDDDNGNVTLWGNPLYFSNTQDFDPSGGVRYRRFLVDLHSHPIAV